MPVQYEGIQAEHLAVRRHAGVFDVSHMGQVEDKRSRRARRCSSGCCPTTSAGCPRAAPSTACCAARTAVCSTTCSPTASPTATFLTVTNAANHERDLAWFTAHAERVRRRRGRPDRATSRCSRSRARRRGRSSAGWPTGRCRPVSTAASARWRASPMLVCGTGYTGEDGVELLLDPDQRARGLGCAARSRRDPGRSRRARHAATRGLLPPVRQRPERGARADRGRASAGAARSRPGSSARRRSRACAPPAPAEKLVAVRDRRPGDRSPGQPGRRRRRRHQRHLLAVPASAGSGWHTSPPSAPVRARRSRSTCAGRSRAAAVVPKPLYRKEAVSKMADPSYPDDLVYHPEHDWARVDGRRGDVRDHLVRPGRARRGRVLRPARDRRRGDQGPVVHRGRVGQGRVGRDRAAVGRDHRGQRLARRHARDDQRGSRTATAGWSRSGCPTPPRRTRCSTRRPTRRRCSELTVHLSHRRRPARDARHDRRRVGSRSCSPTSRTRLRLRPAAGARRRAVRAGGVRGAAGAGGPQRRAPRTRSRSSARGMYDHYVPGADRLDHHALGVPHAVHALPARDLAGRPAGDVRVPDRDLRADRPAGLERLGVRGPERGRRRRLRRQADQRQAPVRGLPRRPPALARGAARRSPTAGRWRSSRRRSTHGVTALPELDDDVSAVIVAAAELPRRRRGSRRDRRPPPTRPARCASAACDPLRARAAEDRPASAASTSRSARARRSATGSTSAARRSASSPPPRR